VIHSKPYLLFKKSSLFVVLLAMLVFMPLGFSAWDNVDYNARVNVTADSGTGEFYVELNSSNVNMSLISSDCSNMRAYSGGSEVKFYPTICNSSAVILFLNQTSNSQVFNIYYGNNTPVSSAKNLDVFTCGDGFDSGTTLNTSIWTVDTAFSLKNISGGLLNLKDDNGRIRLTDCNLTKGYLIQTKWYAVNVGGSAAPNYMTFGWRKFVNTGIWYDGDVQSTLIVTNSSTTSQLYNKDSSGAYAGGYTVNHEGAWTDFIFKYANDGGTAKVSVYENGTEKIAPTAVNIPDTYLVPNIEFAPDADIEALVDYFIVRADRTQPSVTLSSAESLNLSQVYESKLKFNVTSDDMGYQTKLIVNSSSINVSVINSDCSDFYLTYMNGATETRKPFWIQTCNTSGNSVIWFNKTVNQTEDLYLYFDNKTVVLGESDGYGVFPFFEDFSGSSLNASKWVRIQAARSTLTFSNGIMKAVETSNANDGAGGYIVSNFEDSTSHVVMARVNFSSYSDVWARLGIGIHTQDTGKGYDFCVWGGHTYFGWASDDYSNAGDDIAYTPGTWVNVEVRGNASNLRSGYIGSGVSTNTRTDWSANNVSMNVGTHSEVSEWDYYIARKVSDLSELTVIGAVEDTTEDSSNTISVTLDTAVQLSQGGKNVNFTFTPVSSVSLSVCSLWTNSSGSWEDMDAQPQTVANGSLNSLNYTFTDFGTYLWNVKCNNTAGNSTFAASNATVVVARQPTLTTLTVDPASPIYYGVASNFSCSNNASLPVQLFINGTNKTSELNQDVVRAGGSYEVTCATFENETHAADNDTATYNVDKVPSSITVAAQGSTNISGLNKNFTFTLTTVNTTVENCSLWTNATGSWVQTRANQTAMATSGVMGINYTFAASGTYLWNIECHGLATENVTGSSDFNDTNATVTASSLPTIIYSTKVPADLNVTNIIVYGANYTFNITNATTLNLTQTGVYYKVNNSVTEDLIYINGSVSSGYTFRVYSNATGGEFTTHLGDNALLPGSYNTNETALYAMPHYNLSLSGSTIASINLLNVSNYSEFGFFEAMVLNNTPTAGALQVYYCNSSYTAGIVSASDNCYNFYNIQPGAFDHVHSAATGHRIAPFAVNTTTGLLGDVVVTSNSTFILKSSAGSWNLSYANVESRVNAWGNSTNNGVAWTYVLFTGNAHLHQFNGTTAVRVIGTVCDTFSCVNTSVVSDDLEMGGISPMSPIVTVPANTSYTHNAPMSIAYAGAVSPVGNAITGYKIELLNTDMSLNYTIVANDSDGSPYAWTPNQTGNYIVAVTAYDNESLYSTGYSSQFLVGANMTVELVSPADDYIADYWLNQTLTFKPVLTGAASITRCNLMINGSNVSQLNTPTNNSEASFAYAFANHGPYVWTVECLASDGVIGTLANRTIHLQGAVTPYTIWATPYTQSQVFNYYNGTSKAVEVFNYSNYVNVTGVFWAEASVSAGQNISKVYNVSFAALPFAINVSSFYMAYGGVQNYMVGSYVNGRVAGAGGSEGGSAFLWNSTAFNEMVYDNWASFVSVDPDTATYNYSQLKCTVVSAISTVPYVNCTNWVNGGMTPVVQNSTARVQDMSHITIAGGYAYSVANVTLINNETAYNVSGTNFNALTAIPVVSGWVANTSDSYRLVNSTDVVFTVGYNKSGVITRQNGSYVVSSADLQNQVIQGNITLSNTDTILYTDVDYGTTSLIGLATTSNNTLLTGCYQETANSSNSCGGLATGSYVFAEAATKHTPSYLYVNYSKPTDVINTSKWKVKHGNETKYLDIPAACWNYNAAKLVFSLSTVYDSDVLSQSNYSCYNGSAWEVLSSKNNIAGAFWDVCVQDRDNQTACGMNLTATYSGEGGITNIENIFDGNPLTYATVPVDTPWFIYINYTHVPDVSVVWELSGSWTHNCVVYVDNPRNFTLISWLSPNLRLYNPNYAFGDTRIYAQYKNYFWYNLDSPLCKDFPTPQQINSSKIYWTNTTDRLASNAYKAYDGNWNSATAWATGDNVVVGDWISAVGESTGAALAYEEAMDWEYNNSGIPALSSIVIAENYTGDSISEVWNYTQDTGSVSNVNGLAFSKLGLGVINLNNASLNFSEVNATGTRATWSCSSNSSFVLNAPYSNAYYAFCNKSNVFTNVSTVQNMTHNNTAQPYVSLGVDTMMNVSGRVNITGSDTVVNYTGVAFNFSELNASETSFIGYLDFNTTEATSGSAIKSVPFVIPIWTNLSTVGTTCLSQTNTREFMANTTYTRNVSNVTWGFAGAQSGKAYDCTTPANGCLHVNAFCGVNGWSETTLNLATPLVSSWSDSLLDPAVTEQFYTWFSVPSGPTPGGGGGGGGSPTCPLGTVLDYNTGTCVSSALAVNPTALVFNLKPGQKGTQNVNVYNNGDDKFTAKFVGDSSWLSVSPTSMTMEVETSGTIIVSVSAPYELKNYTGKINLYLDEVVVGSLPVTLIVTNEGGEVGIISLLLGEGVGNAIDAFMVKIVFSFGGKDVPFAAVFVALSAFFGFILFTRKKEGLSFLLFGASVVVCVVYWSQIMA